MSEQTIENEELALRVMRVLEAAPSMSQRDMAAKAGMSLGSLNYCLKALMAQGWVKMQNFANSSKKWGYVYVLTPTGLSEKIAITHRFLQRKTVEYERLRSEIQSLEREVSEVRYMNSGKGVS